MPKLITGSGHRPDWNAFMPVPSAVVSDGPPSTHASRTLSFFAPPDRGTCIDASNVRPAIWIPAPTAPRSTLHMVDISRTPRSMTLLQTRKLLQPGDCAAAGQTAIAIGGMAPRFSPHRASALRRPLSFHGGDESSTLTCGIFRDIGQLDDCWTLVPEMAPTCVAQARPAGMLLA